MNSNEIAVKNKTYCINVAQRLGEIVKKLNQNEQVDDGWEPIVQVDGIVIIPEGVTIIAEYAFMLCTMCRVVFPRTLKHIGPGAFRGCKNLRNIDLPATYETIGSSAFEDCDLDGDLPVFNAGDMTDPYRDHILGESAFAKYWKRKNCCPSCGVILEKEGYCRYEYLDSELRYQLSEGIFLINSAMKVSICKSCTPDGDARISAYPEMNIVERLSDKNWEMDELLSETRCYQISQSNVGYGSHNLIASSWNCAVPAKVRVKDHQASVEIPFLIDTQENRERIIFSFGLVPENGIAKVTFDTIFSKRFYGNCKHQDEIPIMNTELGGMIRICKNCRCVQEPHFGYCTPNGKEYYMKILKCDTCEYPADLEMKYRWDLQNALMTPSGWKNIIEEWNLHNELKVPLNQHIPFYVDLHLYNRSDHYFWEGPIMKGAKIYSFWNDEDPRPHFHYRRKDGSEALICFDKPEYLEPSVRLSIQEKLELMRFLSAPTVMHYQYGANNYGEILEYSWLAGNRLEAFPEFTMPNYMLLPD